MRSLTEAKQGLRRPESTLSMERWDHSCFTTPAAWAQVMAVAKDQNGCRFLQRKFDEGGAAAIQAVLPEVLEHLIELMMDPFGNYLIQKLLDRCSEEQRLAVSH